MNNKIDKETIDLHDVIIEAIQEKKGNNIVSINLSKIDGAVTDFFIITNGRLYNTSKCRFGGIGTPKLAKKLETKVWEKEAKKCQGDFT